MYRSYKVQLDPTNEQTTFFKKNCGAARWAYNWALCKKKAAYGAKEKYPSYIKLSKELNQMKGTEELPWAYEVSKCSFHYSLKDCDKAFKNFFQTYKKKTIHKKGFPKFKSKHDNKQTFKLQGAIFVTKNSITLPRIGKVRILEEEYIPINCRVLSATISSKAGKWFVSVNAEYQDPTPTTPTNQLIGVDLGIKTLATCSNGTTFENPKALKSNLKKLKRRQKNLSRKKKGSKNRIKAKLKVARLHYRIANIRKDALHKVTSKIVNENQIIVLEDLKISNMIKNHNLAQAIGDVGLYEFRRQIEYKVKWNQREVVFVDTFFPSSKKCSCCGAVKSELKLTERVYKCNLCDLQIDRDLNAALNLKQYYTEGSSGIQACGDRSSPDLRLVSLSVKQEFNVE